jgi:peptidoglycan/LPS O-acetylase OafA/YrhL
VTQAKRYAALDSLRGVCAVLVALFHFHTSGIISNLALVRNGWLFVDFFFVLSGFVIACSYLGKISDGLPFKRFLWFRFGRIYPLHALIVLMLIALELIWASGWIGHHAARAPWAPGRTLADAFRALTLTNAFGFNTRLGWNGPSWSIGAEFWTYIVFGLLATWLGRKSEKIWPVISLIAAAWLAVTIGDLNTTFDAGFVRCLYGFGLGVATWCLFERRPGAASPYATWIEIAAVLVAGIFVCLTAGGYATFLGPILFAGVVWVFAREGGAVSRLLKTAPFLTLGAASYSIYLWHGFVEARFMDLLRPLHFVGVVTKPVNNTTELVGVAWRNDVATIGMLCVLIVVAILSYRVIELPAQRWLRGSRLGAETPGKTAAL